MHFRTLLLLVLSLLPAPAFSEIWDFSCTEAVSLLKAAQEQVVQKHDQLQEAKFSFRHLPQKFDGCEKHRRGFHGGKIHCVSHQAQQGGLLQEILLAQHSLDVSIQDFVKYQQDIIRACVVSDK